MFIRGKFSVPLNNLTWICSIAPLSVRIVEATAKPSSWQAIQESLSLLPGPQFEEKQDIPEGIKQRRTFILFTR